MHYVYNDRLVYSDSEKNMKHMVIKNVILEKGDTLLLSSEHR